MAHSLDSLELMSRFDKARILVIGDICLDRFVRGDVNRISSEAPIPVMVERHTHYMLGQAGNAFSNLIGLQTKPTILSVIGDDNDGKIIQNLVKETGSDSQYLIVNKQSPSTVKTRFMSAHQQVFRVDTEPLPSYSSDVEDIIFEKIISLLPEQDAIILSDYGYGLLSHKMIRHVIETAKNYSIPVLVDPRGHDLSKYRGAFLATPNKKELTEATRGLPVESDEQVIYAAEQLISTSGIQNIVATRSQDGMSIISSTDLPLHLRTTAREVYDVSGAGDTVIATIAAGIAVGIPLSIAATIANVAAGIVVGKVGTAPIRIKELLNALKNSEQPDNKKTEAQSTSATTWEEASEQVNRWRARGLKIGFTNGCFDILHAGHVNYLNEARRQCDRLVLGLNHDQSIRLLKGPTRPVNHQDARATVIGGLGSVDMVVFFGASTVDDDNTAGDLIRRLKPDIYFKGDDYTIEALPEAKIMASFGGKIELIHLTEGLSTTKTIEKMKLASSHKA